MPRVSIEKVFLTAVDRIHAVAMNDASWEQALAAAVDFVGAQAMGLNFFDPASQQVTRMESANIDPAGLQRYIQEMGDTLATNNPRVQAIYLKINEAEIVADSDVWSAKQRGRMQFFSELMHVMDLHNSLNAYARKTLDGRPWLALITHLGPRHEMPARETRRRLAMLLPHLRRACAVEERLASARREAATLAAALDGVGEAVALVDAAGRIVKANRLAQDLFRQSAGLALAVDERLLFNCTAASDAFSRALAECASPLLLLGSRAGTPSAQITVHRQDLRPLILTLQALPSELKTANRAVAILFIADPHARPIDVGASLRAAYGLSPAEGRLVQALSDGLSLREFAKSHSMSYETVRSYLRNIFVKTGARRQSDLVRLTRNLR